MVGYCTIWKCFAWCMSCPVSCPRCLLLTTYSKFSLSRSAEYNYVTMISGAITSFAAGYMKIRWKLWSELVIGAITGAMAALLLLMGSTENIWVCYVTYILFRGLYQFLVPIAMWVSQALLCLFKEFHKCADALYLLGTVTTCTCPHSHLHTYSIHKILPSS